MPPQRLDQNGGRLRREKGPRTSTAAHTTPIAHPIEGGRGTPGLSFAVQRCQVVGGAEGFNIEQKATSVMLVTTRSAVACYG